MDAAANVNVADSAHPTTMTTNTGMDMDVANMDHVAFQAGNVNNNNLGEDAAGAGAGASAGAGVQGAGLPGAVGGAAVGIKGEALAGVSENIVANAEAKAPLASQGGVGSLPAGSGGGGAAPTQANTGAASSGSLQVSAEGRVLNKQIVIPIAFGTVAFWLGKKADEYNSHRWTVYARSARNQDLSTVISKVVFHLHPSFQNATRTIEQGPFEVTEKGWGEFEIQISLYLSPDSGYGEPVDVFHMLKLYPQEEGQQQTTKKPVVVEAYEEIVIHEPPKAFYDRVVAANTGTSPAPPSAIDSHYLAHQDDYEFSTYVEKKSSLASYITKLNAMVADAS
ncbi:transcription initiation factor TFIID subunit 14b [Pseudoscourfieldia marina]